MLLGAVAVLPNRGFAQAFMLKWGSSGTGNGQFSSVAPQLLTLDSAGNVYASDLNNHRIQKFSSTGTFLQSFGSSGTGDGQLNTPIGVAVDSSGNLYVADRGNNRIQKFAADGSFLLKFGSSGSNNGQFFQPTGIVLDASGNLYVADFGNSRVQKFTSAGVYLSKFGSSGSGDGQFTQLIALTLDSAGNIYTTEATNNRVQKFTSAGVFVSKFGGAGSGDGQFNLPYGLAFDPSGNLYVADGNNGRVQKFTSAGVFISKFGSLGSADGQFGFAAGIAITPGNEIYVSDRTYARIQKFGFNATVTAPTAGSYVAGANLDFVATFPTAVTVAGGVPSLSLTIGSTTRTAAYVSGSGTNALRFRYLVVAADNDADGIAVSPTISLNGATIKDTASANVPLTFTAPVTTSVLVDNTAPTVASSNRQNPAGETTGAASVVFRVAFSESVTGVGTSDFSLGVTGTVNATIQSVSATSGTNFDVTVSSITGSGTLRLDLKSSGTGIADAGGNAIAAGFTGGQTYTIDRAVPTVSSIALQSPATASTSAASVTWRVTFSEAVTGVDVADFALRADSVPTAVIRSVTAVSSSIYDVVVDTIVGEGLLNLILKSTGTGIADTAANAISGGFLSGQSYTIDRTAPGVTSIARQSPSAESTGASSVTFRITFGEAITGLDTSDFALTTTGTATGTIGSVATVSSASADVTVNNVGGTGTLRLDLNGTGTGITDTAGNPIGTGGFTGGQSYTLQAGVSIATQPATQTAARGSAVAFSVTATGPGTLSYQWYKDGAVVSGATSATLSLASAQLSDAGNYSVLVTGSAAAALSDTATLTVTGAPVAGTVTATAGRVVEFGGTVTLTAHFTGSGSFTYQWAKDGTTLTGKTESSLTIANAQAGDAGDYTVTATNSVGNVTSSTLAVTVASVTAANGPIRVATNSGAQVSGRVDANGVLDGTVTTGGADAAKAPTIAGVSTAANALVDLGSVFTLSAGASGNPAPTFQWYRNGVLLTGATGATYSVSSAAATDAGDYTVQATNSGGTVTSSSIGVTVGRITSGGGPVSFATSGGTRIEGEVDATSGALSGSVTASGGTSALPVIDGISAKSGLLLTQGASATLSAAASGNPAPTYQWLKDGAVITGATGRSLTLTNVQPADAARYSVRATNASGSATSDAVIVTVVNLGTGTGPVTVAGGNGTQIAGQLDANGVLTGSVTTGGSGAVVAPKISGVNAAADLLLRSGESATFSAVATGNPTPAYQWLKNGNAIAGATTSAFTLANVTATDSGSYSVRATNSAGTVTSSALGVTVGQVPSAGGSLALTTSGGTTIAGEVDGTSGVLTGSVTASGGTAAAPKLDGIRSRAGLLLDQGASATLSISASGNPAPTFQWLRNGVALTGETRSTLALTNVQPADAANYSVRATNAGGSVTSPDFPVTVVNLGTGNGPVTIAGGNGTQISGQISSSGVLTGGATTGGAAAAVAPRIAGINTTSDLLVTQGAAATLSAVVTGQPTPTLQWRRNGVAIAGATGANYTIASAGPNDAGSYTLVASNASGNVTSGTLGVTVGQFGTSGPISFSTSGGTEIGGNVDATTGALSGAVTASGGANVAPTFQGISAKTGLLLNQGASATLRVSASGNPAPTYQWLRDGVALTGATGTTLALTNVQPADAGTYSVRATNAGGSATSSGVPVTVVNLGTGTGPVTIAGGNGNQINATLDADGVLTGGVTSGGGAAGVAPKIAGVNTVADLLVDLGATATLSAVATGSPTPTFQWFRNGTAIAGATQSSHTITGATLADAGNYEVRATNSAGTATSTRLGVTVGRVPAAGGTLELSTSGGSAIAGNVDGTSGVLTGSVTASGGNPAAPAIDGITARTGLLLNQGATATLRIAASGNPAPTYQWFKDNVAITGATAATLTLTNVQPADAATYRATATNAGGSVSSAGVPVTVIQIGTGTGPITIAGGTGTQISGNISASGVLTGSVTSGSATSVVAPLIAGVRTTADLLVETGTSATLEAVATGSPAPAYQWFHNGVALSGATRSTHTIATAAAANSGTYSVTATNSAGQVTSAQLGVTVGRFGASGGPLDFATSGGTRVSGDVDSTSGVLRGSVTASGNAATAPVIDGISARSGVMVNQGSAVTLSVAASGNPAPGYQWLKNGTAIAGATRATFSLTNAQPADAATYTARVSNTGGSVDSAAIPVTVFTLAANGGVSISGSNGTQIAGNVDSTGVLLGGATTGGPDAVVAPRLSQVSSTPRSMIQVGGAFTLNTLVTGTPAPTLQWTRNGAALAGQTDARLHLARVAVADEGRYAVVATNSAGSATSAEHTLVVTTPPAAVTNAPRIVALGPVPGTLLVDRGTPVTLRAVVTGNPEPTYQWFKDGASLSGQTGRALSIGSAQAGDAGRYVVRVTNPLGQVTSETLELTVARIASAGEIQVATSGGLVISGTVEAGSGALTGSVTTGGAATAVAPRVTAVTGNPGSLLAPVGSTATLAVSVSGSPTPTIAWFKDGVALPGRTGTSITVTNVQAADAGIYSARVANSRGSATSGNIELAVYGTTEGRYTLTTPDAKVLTQVADPATGGGSTPPPPVAPPAPVARLANLSVRSLVPAGDTVSAGFVVSGAETRRLLLRAVGPGLTAFGVAGALARPQIRVLIGGTVVATNAGFAQSVDAAAITQAARDVGAFALNPTSADAAVLLPAAAGSYSMEVSGVAGSSGAVLLEIYDADSSATGATRVVNFSGRLAVAAGERAQLGFAVSGSAVGKSLLLRAVGPTLGSAFGLTPALAQPVLTLRQGGTLVGENAGWTVGGNATAIANAAAAVGAFVLPATSADAALLASLNGGTYDIEIRNAAAGAGFVLFELYELP